MKKYSYKFSIAEPCAESWLNMTPAEKGNFCKNCQKEVIDFSAMKDEDIILLIENTKGSVCGRFRNTQLNRPMQLRYNNVQRPFPVRTILAGIVALTLLQPVVSEASVRPLKQEYNIVASATPVNFAQNIVGDSSVVFRGRILQELDSLPATYAVLYIQGSQEKINVDSTGRFSFILPDSLIGKPFYLEVHGNRYEKNYFAVQPEAVASKQEQVFLLSAMDYITDGLIIMEREDVNPKKKKRKP